MKKIYKTPLKTNKVYYVKFGEFNGKDEEFLNVVGFTVLANDVEEAIINAKGYLTAKEEATHFVEEVKLVTCIS